MLLEICTLKWKEHFFGEEVIALFYFSMRASEHYLIVWNLSNYNTLLKFLKVIEIKAKLKYYIT